jgi:hypothetical protein
VLADGSPAIAVSSLVGASLHVERVEPTGGYTRFAMLSLSAGDHIGVGDLDGDSDDDLAVNVLGTTRVNLILGSASTFTLAPRADAVDTVTALAVGSLTGDAQADLALVVGAAVYPYALADPTIPGGALVGRPGVALPGDGRDLAIGDLDADGLPDLVAVSVSGTGHALRFAPGVCP